MRWTGRKPIKFEVTGLSASEPFEVPETHTFKSFSQKYNCSSPGGTQQKWLRLGRPSSVTVDEMLKNGESGVVAWLFFTLIMPDGSREKVGFVSLTKICVQHNSPCQKMNTLRSRWYSIGQPEEAELSVFLMDRVEFGYHVRKLRGLPGSQPKKKALPTGPTGDLASLSGKSNTGAARAEADYWDSLNPH